MNRIKLPVKEFHGTFVLMFVTLLLLTMHASVCGTLCASHVFDAMRCVLLCVGTCKFKFCAFQCITRSPCCVCLVSLLSEFGVRSMAHRKDADVQDKKKHTQTYTLCVSHQQTIFQISLPLSLLRV